MINKLICCQENEELLGPPSYGNFKDSNKELIDNLYEKIDNCGIEEVEFVNKYSSEVFSVISYCDNRSCDNDDCKNHRLYKYLKEHKGQIQALSNSIENPLGWVFTGWKVPVYDLSKDFVREKFRLLNKLLKQHSRTPYSVHMEIKVYRKFDKLGNQNEDFGNCYVHFHVVSGGIKDLKEVRNLWGRQIRYEVAIRPKNLGYYVSKYASKTPKFDEEWVRQYYHYLVYKSQMHKYSIKKCDVENIVSSFIPMDLLLYEVRNAYMRDSYYNAKSKHNFYFKIIEDYFEKRSKPKYIMKFEVDYGG